jgi:hypothetical protein
MTTKDNTDNAATFLTTAIINRYNYGGKEKMYCAINRPNVFVVGPDDKYVKTVDQLLEMVQHVEQLHQEMFYCGWDHNEVNVYKFRTPVGYAQRVPWIKVRHMSDMVMRADRLVVMRLPPQLPQTSRETVILCRDIEPLWSHRANCEISAETMYTNYHWITMKVRKKDNTLKAWFPGVDRHSAVCQGLEDTFCLVGRYYEKPRHITFGGQINNYEA